MALAMSGSSSLHMPCCHAQMAARRPADCDHARPFHPVHASFQNYNAAWKRIALALTMPGLLSPQGCLHMGSLRIACVQTIGQQQQLVQHLHHATRFISNAKPAYL